MSNSDNISASGSHEGNPELERLLEELSTGYANAAKLAAGDDPSLRTELQRLARLGVDALAADPLQPAAVHAAPAPNAADEKAKREVEYQERLRQLIPATRELALIFLDTRDGGPVDRELLLKATTKLDELGPSEQRYNRLIPLGSGAVQYAWAIEAQLYAFQKMVATALSGGGWYVSPLRAANSAARDAEDYLEHV